jgi:hypothetical protein
MLSMRTLVFIGVCVFAISCVSETEAISFDDLVAGAEEAAHPTHKKEHVHEPDDHDADMEEWSTEHLLGLDEPVPSDMFDSLVHPKHKSHKARHVRHHHKRVKHVRKVHKKVRKAHKKARVARKPRREEHERRHEEEDLTRFAQPVNKEEEDRDPMVPTMDDSVETLADSLLAGMDHHEKKHEKKHERRHEHRHERRHEHRHERREHKTHHPKEQQMPTGGHLMQGHHRIHNGLPKVHVGELMETHHSHHRHAEEVEVQEHRHSHHKREHKKARHARHHRHEERSHHKSGGILSAAGVHLKDKVPEDSDIVSEVDTVHAFTDVSNAIHRSEQPKGLSGLASSMLEESDRQEKEEAQVESKKESQRAQRKRENEKRKAAAKKLAHGHYVELDLSGDEPVEEDEVPSKEESQDDLSDALGFDDDDDEDDY